MSRESVLSAAAALDEFTAARLAAYCDETESSVQSILAHSSELFACVPVPPGAAARWRVSDRAALRAALAVESAQTGVERSRPTKHGGSVEARLLLAERTLADCAREESADARRVMVSTALNYVRQVVADLIPTAMAWWELNLSSLDAVDEDRIPTSEVSRSRLWTNFTLALLANAEVQGTVSINLVVDIVRDMTSLDEQGWKIDRFIELLSVLADRADTGAEPSRVSRLLSAVAVGRAWLKVRSDIPKRAEPALEHLKTLASNLQPVVGGRPADLYRVLDTLPDGRSHIAVYSDLLTVLPRQYQFAPTQSVVPGTVVEAIASPEADCLLHGCAAELETGLRQSPYSSESALIGGAEHVLRGLGQSTIGLDGTVQTRSDDACRDLLSIANVF